MTPEAVAGLLWRNYELECESKVRCKEAKLLRDELAQRQERLANADTQAKQFETVKKQFEAANKRLQAEMEELKIQLAWLKNQLFGARSERRILEAMSPADQLWLGEQMLETPEQPPAIDESMADVEEQARNKGKNKGQAKSKAPRSEDSASSRLHFDDSVPIEEVIVKDPEMEALPREQVEIVGQEVTFKLAQRSPYVVIKVVKTAWRRKGEETIHRPIFARVVDRSIADVSFLAGMAVDKHCHHIPLYRQHQRLTQAGIHIERSTLTRLNQRVAEMCELTYQAQLSSILQSKVITVDESPTPAGRMGGKMKKGYYWAVYGDNNEVAFIYSPTRSRAVLDKLLEGFQGTLQSDGYRAYESFCKKNDGVCWAGCWAHTRRKFLEAETLARTKVPNILQELQLLYDIEARGRDKPKKLKELRDKESRPIVDRLFALFKTELAESAFLPSNKFIRALEYARKHEVP